jgi:hypothetical protein
VIPLLQLLTSPAVVAFGVSSLFGVEAVTVQTYCAGNWLLLYGALVYIPVRAM